MALDVAADVTSLNSLSFAEMVCIQNQHSIPQEENVRQSVQAGEASSEFEFRHAIPQKNYPAVIPNGQLQKPAIPLPPDQSPKAKQTSSKSVKWRDQINNGRSDITESSQDRCNKVKTAADKKRTNIFKSFATPCSDCRAVEPTHTIRAQSVAVKR